MLLVSLLGCVIRYGEPVSSAVQGPLPEPVDFSDVEERLGALLVSSADDNQQARIREALLLASQMKTQSPQAQLVTHAYLTQVLYFEERATPQVLDSSLMEANLTIDLPPITEEVLVEDIPLVESAPPTSLPDTDGSDTAEPPLAEPEEVTPNASRIAPVNITDLRESVRLKTESGDVSGALSLLESCRNAPCWEAVADLWIYTRDLHVYQCREEEARQYLAAKDLSDPAERLLALQGIEQRLQVLLDAHPDSRYTEDITDSLGIVQSAMSGDQGEQ